MKKTAFETLVQALIAKGIPPAEARAMVAQAVKAPAASIASFSDPNGGRRRANVERHAHLIREAQKGGRIPDSKIDGYHAALHGRSHEGGINFNSQKNDRSRAQMERWHRGRFKEHGAGSSASKAHAAAAEAWKSAPHPEAHQRSIDAAHAENHDLKSLIGKTGKTGKIPAPTDTNLFAVSDTLHRGRAWSSGKLPSRVPAGDQKHIKRVIDAGMTDQDAKGTHTLNAKGRAAILAAGYGPEYHARVDARNADRRAGNNSGVNRSRRQADARSDAWANMREDTGGEE
jgi:hypothetical protein